MDGWDVSHEYMRAMNDLRRLPWHSLLKDISVREYTFLEMIRRFRKKHPDVPGIYVSDLAADMCITKSAVSKMLQHLEQCGWIERMIDKDSRRNTFVLLTQEGERVCDIQRTRCMTFMQHVTEDLGEAHMKMILAGIREMTQAMAREMNALEQTK